MTTLGPCLLFLLLLPLPLLSSGLCPTSCVCNDDQLFVECVEGGLEVMPNTLNPGLTKIVYKNNEFLSVDVSLRFLPKLVSMDLSHNKIVTISDKAFASQAVLTSLKLEGNKISDLGNRTFFGLKSLEALSMRKNLVEKVHAEVFQHTPKIKELDLGRNRITLIEAAAFQGLTALRILNLADNDLPSIPIQALALLPELAELYLSGNPLLSVPANAFSSFRALSVMHLSSARIAGVDRSAFRGLGMLKQLKLADNNLSSIPAPAFANVPGLMDLDVGRNPLTIISPGDFSSLTKLVTFDLSGCGGLRIVEDDAFRGCVDLERVSVSLNRRLARFSPQALDAVPNLRFLNLADNALPFLEAEEMSVPWKSLESLDLSGNPWRCDCDLAFLTSVLSDREDGSAKCHSPVTLRGALLSKVTAASVDCSTKSDEAIRHEPMADGGEGSSGGHNATAVIISVAVVIVTLVIALLILIAFRCRHRAQDWLKALRWQRHDRALARKGAAHAGVGHHVIHEGSPYASHQYASEGGSASGSGRGGGAGGGYPYEDEHYYYVATMQNRVASGKHIPVTEL